MLPSLNDEENKMKQLNNWIKAAAFSTMALAAAGSVSAASVEPAFDTPETLVRASRPTPEQGFIRAVSRQTDRMVEQGLSQQTDVVLARMEENPTAVVPLDIQIEQ